MPAAAAPQSATTGPDSANAAHTVPAAAAPAARKEPRNLTESARSSWHPACGPSLVLAKQWVPPRGAAGAVGPVATSPAATPAASRTAATVVATDRFAFVDVVLVSASV